MKTKNAFTLIELLVALGILILLATIGTVTYLSAVRHSQDGKRKTDIEEIRSALAMYYSNNDSYPSTLPSAGNPLTDAAGNIYLETVPSDPKTGEAYEYQTNAEGTCFWLKADLEGTPCYVVVGGEKDECPRQCVLPTATPTPVPPTPTPTPLMCWGRNGSCDSGCNRSSISSTTVYTSCRTSSCTCNQWRRPDGSRPQNRAGPSSFISELRDMSGNVVGWTFRCWSHTNEHCKRPNDCYEGINPYSCHDHFANSRCNEYWNPPCYRYAHNYRDRLQLQWVSGSYCTSYYVSGSTAKYTGSGSCSGDGSGNCYKLTGAGTYYTGGSGCGGGGCSRGTYYSGYQQCEWY